MNTQRAFLNSLLVYVLLFVSGSQRANFAPAKFVMLAFIVALAAWFLFTDRKVSEKFSLYLIVFSGLLLALSLYTGGSLSFASVLGTMLNFMIAYLILRTVGQNFTDTYIRVIGILALISVFGYITDVLHLFQGLVTKLPSVGGGRGYEGFLYLFRHAYHPYRNNGIFFEPGAYQGFLNAGIFLILFCPTNFESRTRWVYLGILTAALITTFSTTGFAIFCVLFGLFLYRSDMASYSVKAIIVGLLLIGITTFAAQFQESIGSKLENYLNPSQARAGWSAENRSFDLQTDLMIFKEHIWGLGFEKYKKEFALIGRTDPELAGTSSNGVTSTLACYGLPYALFIFSSYYWAMRKLLNDALLAGAAFLMFMMFLWGESFYNLAAISFSIIAAAFVFDRAPMKQQLSKEAKYTQIT